MTHPNDEDKSLATRLRSVKDGKALDIGNYAKAG
jgi:hypothetical protein